MSERIKTVATAAAAKAQQQDETKRHKRARRQVVKAIKKPGPSNGQRLTPLGPASILQPTVRSRVVQCTGG